MIAGLGYLVYTTPKIEDHKAFLLAELQQTYPVSDEMQAQIWKEVDYSNFFVCSFMKTSIFGYVSLRMWLFGLSSCCKPTYSLYIN